eukprot:TRINITY_DN12562_c0_g1_i2.p1 TRINITY_DN12562_c0_g1~~TRINITY_DN12562_c0_g1_i2.p1  ORF type:complete len:298 (+),score=22.54 TRINITY_DN12562_c0_g1_i2:88-981(+)
MTFSWQKLSGSCSPVSQKPNTGKTSVTGKNKKLVRELEANGIVRDTAPSPPAKNTKTKILLNVYNLMSPETNQKFNYLGVGIYHSGVVVHGKEWSFAGSRDPNIGEDVPGVFSMLPKTALGPEMFHSSIEIGETDLTQEQIAWILAGMGKQWTLTSYHILGKNCNHFSEAFVGKLAKAAGVKYSFPGWVNRAAKLGDLLVPNALLEYVMRSLPQPPPEAFATPPPSGHSCNCPHSHSHAQESRAETPELPPIPDDLSSLTVRQLRTILFLRKIDWKDCIEKSDMVAKIKEYQREHSA